MIEEAIASVLPQPCDLVVYDDGSTDLTPALSVRPDLTYIRGEHQGMTAAFNRAVERTDSDLIAFLGSDDKYLPGKIAGQVALMEETGADCCFTSLAFLPWGGRRWKTGDCSPKHIRIEDYDPTRFRSFQGNVHTGTAMVRREKWIPWREEIVTGGADMLWVYEMACRGMTFCYVPECSYIVGKHEGRQINRRRGMDQAQVIRELKDHYWPLVAEIGGSREVLRGVKGYRVEQDTARETPV